MIATIEPLNSGFAITDSRDKRAQYYTALRQRFGKFLHEASVSLRQQGEENTVDAVHALVSWIRAITRPSFTVDPLDTVHPYLFTGLWRQQRQVGCVPIRPALRLLRPVQLLRPVGQVRVGIELCSTIYTAKGVAKSNLHTACTVGAQECGIPF